MTIGSLMINNRVLITGRSNTVVIDEWSTEWAEGEIRSDTAQRQIPNVSSLVIYRFRDRSI